MGESESQAVRDLIAEAIDWHYRQRPVLASFDGYGDLNHLLPDLSEDAIRDMAMGARGRAADLSHALASAGLSHADRIDLTVVLSCLQTHVHEAEVVRGWQRDPGYYAEEVLYGGYVLQADDTRPPAKRLDDLCCRLEQVPRLFDAARTNLTAPSRPAIAAALDTVPAALLFIRAAGDGLAETDDARRRLAQARSVAIAAAEAFSGWLADELLPVSTDDISIGRDGYEWLVKRSHFLPYSSDELLEFGKRMLADSTTKLEATARELSGSGDWRRALADTGSEYPAPAGVLEAYRRDVDEIREFCRSRDLISMPDDDRLIIEETPEFARILAPYAAYLPSGPFSGQERPGRFWVTPVDPEASPEELRRLLSAHNRYARAITSLHEGYPGHHLQMTLACRLGSPARWAVSFPTFIEGWAFYCEQMMVEQGFLSEPGHRLWQLRDELWRAARIVVDVSYHCADMTVEQGRDFLVAFVGMEPEHALAEARWYACRPGYPMTYMMGKHELLTLRGKFMAQGRSLREFHDRLLATAGLPIPLAAQELLEN